MGRNDGKRRNEMGRMKELCINIMNENIPIGATIADITKMKELELENWEEYERYQKNTRLLRRESENSGETEKIQAAGKIFEDSLRESEQQKNNKQ
jgi:hypothetical protein